MSGMPWALLSWLATLLVVGLALAVAMRRAASLSDESSKGTAAKPDPRAPT
jgi:hypothetical protein